MVSRKFGSFRNESKWKFVSSRKNARRFTDRIILIGPCIQNEELSSVSTQRVFVTNHVKSSKYTLLTFLPRNLFEQFRRLGNFYFLIVGLVQLLIDSPVSPFTSISPLVFVVLLTMIKQGYEDLRRHRADSLINNKKVTRLGAKGLESIAFHQISVGDILKIENNSDIPCDMILLSSSNSNGTAHIMTANLDGESNLKVVQASSSTKDIKEPSKLRALQCKIECESPNSDLHRFVGRLKMHNGASVALGPNNLLLRGVKLLNTSFIYGVAVYTGIDTKMSRNSGRTANKFSTIELALNRYLIFFASLLVSEIIVATALQYSTDIHFKSPVPWYLTESPLEISAHQIFQDSLSFLVLFNYIIPISLYVTLEMQKFWGSLFLIWDSELFVSGKDVAKCNSSDLNEELGQVQYLFSDKTGTLTENIMICKECSIHGIRYVFENELSCQESTKENPIKSKEFLLNLSLCHTVQVSRSSSSSETVTYNASSPDEKAIVEACHSSQTSYLGEKENEEKSTICVLQNNVLLSFEKLHVLDFDSTRKCMSVILRDSSGLINIISKGAESSILPKCTSGEIIRVEEHINEFATRGLRTLALARKIIGEEDYEAFLTELKEASESLENREEKIRGLYEAIEDDFELLGAVGIEDKLQEDVKETLIKLTEAEIKVWILTGDKKETAMNVSTSCGHYHSSMNLIDICGSSSSSQIQSLLSSEHHKLNTLSLMSQKHCLIIDGSTLKYIFSHSESIGVFCSLALRCQSVICCRMSPLQKAEIVKTVKYSSESPITASVGDGANDVSMIQEAHVGIGIIGREGKAAERASDFAIGRFKHLQRILFVHGHWYYVRVSLLVQFFFYKNVTAFTCQFLFAFYNSFSTQTLFDSINLTLYNILYTSLPIFIFGLLEQNTSRETLMSQPRHYRKIANNALLAPRNFLAWFFEGIWHSIVIFFGVSLLDNSTISEAEFGFIIYQNILFIVHLRLLLTAKYWNVLLVLSIAFSLLVFWLITSLIQGLIVSPSFPNLFNGNVKVNGSHPLSLTSHWIMFRSFSSLRTWLWWLLSVPACLLPDIVTTVYRKTHVRVLNYLKVKVFGLWTPKNGSFLIVEQSLQRSPCYDNVTYLRSFNSLNHLD